MAMGGVGDHPITDILLYDRPVFSPKVDGLIKETAKYLPDYRINALMDWFAPPPLDEMESFLSKKLEELKSGAGHNGWDA